MMAGNPIAHAFAVDEAGNPVALQDHQLAGAGQLQPLSPVEASQLTKRGQDADYVDQNYGTAGKAALGFGSGLTLGLGPAAMSHMGLLDQGHLEAAEQSGAFGAGDVAGMLAPALLTGGESIGARSVIGKALRYGTPAGLMGEAGGAASRLVGRLLPEAGLMGKTLSPALRMAAQGATEGALISAAHTASDDIIQNKPLAAQALLASGANGALFGGLVGGLLGGAAGVAGAGIDAIGGSASRLAGGGTRDVAAARALKHLGADAGDIAKLREAEGGLPGAVKDYNDAMANGGTGYAAKAGHIHTEMKTSLVKLNDIVEGAVKDLQEAAPNGMPKAERVTARIEQDVLATHGDGLSAMHAEKTVSELGKELESIKTWKGWADSREVLASRMDKSTGVTKDVYQTALNAYDSELRTAMDTAHPEAAAMFSAAATQARVAKDLVEMTGRKSAAELAVGSPLSLTNQDLSTAGFAMFTGGNPLVAAGIIAGRKIGAHAQRAMEGPIAEYSARTAMGAHAGGAVVNIGKRVSDTMKTFLGGARQVGIKAAVAPKLSYTMKGYEASIALADQLTSANHMAKVRENTEALAAAGHPDLAQEMAETYGRAVAYVKKNQPKGGAEVNASKLGKAVKALSPDTQGMKFIRQLHAIQDPMSIVDGMMSGNVSRDAVAAVKYVFPDLHQDIVLRASNEILAMKEAGRFLPADKVAMLGTVLDAPIDSTLEKGFIDAVQQGLAANKATPTQAPQGPPATTDTSSFQTPLQHAIA